MEVSAVNTRWQLLPAVTWTAHSPLTFQLCSVHTNHCAPSHPQMRSFWKSRNTILNLLASVLSVSLFCLLEFAACQFVESPHPLCVFKALLRTCLFQQAFPQIELDCGFWWVFFSTYRLCVCTWVYLHEWCVLVHLSFPYRKICSTQQPSVIVILWLKWSLWSVQGTHYAVVTEQFWTVIIFSDNSETKKCRQSGGWVSLTQDDNDELFIYIYIYTEGSPPVPWWLVVCELRWLT